MSMTSVAFATSAPEQVCDRFVSTTHQSNGARNRSRLVKTEFCRYVKRGCRDGSACRFAHAASELQPKPNLRKTSMCKAWLSGYCPSDVCKCPFAHGWDELVLSPACSSTTNSPVSPVSSRSNSIISLEEAVLQPEWSSLSVPSQVAERQQPAWAWPTDRASPAWRLPTMCDPPTDPTVALCELLGVLATVDQGGATDGFIPGSFVSKTQLCQLLLHSQPDQYYD